MYLSGKLNPEVPYIPSVKVLRTTQKMKSSKSGTVAVATPTLWMDETDTESKVMFNFNPPPRSYRTFKRNT